MPNLVVLSGLRRGTVLPLQERVVLGRDADVDLRLPDLLVSSRHAELAPAGDGFTVHDLASTNGTYLNGKRVQGTGVLELEDVLQLGATEVLYTAKEEPEEVPRQSRVHAALAPLAADDPEYALRLLSDEEHALTLDPESGPLQLALPVVGAVQRSFALAGDLEALVERIARAFTRAVGGRGVIVSLAREGRHAVAYRGVVAEDTLYSREEPEFAVREDVIERALRERGAFLTRAGPDTAETAVSSVEAPLLALGVSLPSASGIVGAVYVHDVRRDLEGDDLRLLFLISQLAGVNVRGHLLLEELRERNTALEEARAELARFNEELRGTVDERTAELSRVDRRVRLFGRIVETIPEAVVTTTLDGAVTSWNPAAETLYGYAAGEVLGEFLPTVPDSGGAGFERVLNAVKNGRTLTVRTERVARDDRVVPVDATYAPVADEEGSIVGLVEIGRDLSEQLRFEERMRFQERLASFGELAAGLAHELGGPLTNLRSGLDYLLARERSPLETRESLEVLQSEIARLHRLVQQALDLARWQAPKIAPVSQPELLDYVAAAVEARAKALGVEVVRLDGDPQPMAGDADQLKQALLNLTSNALEAMPAGGRLELGPLDDDDGSGFLVRDSGSGIEPDDLERVFRLFFSKRSDGSGIGMAIVKRIIDMHGGRIELESEPGEGTTVRLQLPRGREETP